MSPETKIFKQLKIRRVDSKIYHYNFEIRKVALLQLFENHKNHKSPYIWPKLAFLRVNQTDSYQEFLCPVEPLYLSDEKSITVEK